MGKKGRGEGQKVRAHQKSVTFETEFIGRMTASIGKSG